MNLLHKHHGYSADLIYRDGSGSGDGSGFSSGYDEGSGKGKGDGTGYTINWII